MCQEGHHALMVLSGEPVEFFFRYGLKEQVVFFDHLHEFPEGITAFSFFEKDLVKVLPGLDGFHQWPNTKQ